MNVLIDTSLWVGHFRYRNGELVELLEQDRVLTHPMIIVELACEIPPAPREKTLADLALLQQVKPASLDEVLVFIEREALYGLGCGLVDMVLLASTLITAGVTLWTLDKRLGQLCERFGVAYRTAVH
ncbi:MAG TPA: PIN domain-containing protein [Accumulibacter sp.]|nr:PIN domain-containing protein [Accumulibacter sp.]HPP47268.1 PIN domain-containing protein [Accumulibacter sp.]